MAYTIHTLTAGQSSEMLSSGQTRGQVINALQSLNLIEYGEKWLARLPKFGRELRVIHPIIETRLGLKRDYIVRCV